MPRAQTDFLLGTSVMFKGYLPQYVLDDARRLVDWNASFETLIAAPHRLRRGQPTVPPPGTLPDPRPGGRPADGGFVISLLSDEHAERLEYPTKEYGTVVFRKLPPQVPDALGAGGTLIGLNVESAEKYDSLWHMLLEVTGKESTWTDYAACYDEIIGNFPPYQALRDRLVRMVDGAQLVLDGGSGTGNTTLSLLRVDPKRHVTSVDLNDAMLSWLRAKLRREPSDLAARAVLVHESLTTFLHNTPPETFDGCVLLNLLFALNAPEKCVHEVARVLKPGGVLALSNPRSTTDVNHLFEAIRKAYGLDDTRCEWEGHPLHARFLLWAQAYARNRELQDIARRHTTEQIAGWVRDAGLTITESDPNEYVDCVVVIRATKPRTR